MITFLKMDINIFSIVILMAIMLYYKRSFKKFTFEVTSLYFVSIIVVLNILTLILVEVLGENLPVLNLLQFNFKFLTYFSGVMFIYSYINKKDVSKIFIIANTIPIIIAVIISVTGLLDADLYSKIKGIIVLYYGGMGIGIILKNIHKSSKLDLILLSMYIIVPGTVIFIPVELTGGPIVAPVIACMVAALYIFMEDSLITLDVLTGCVSRNAFIYSMNNLKSNNSKFSLVFIDLDKFKKLNEKNGHDVGDEALKKISSIIMETLEKKDYLTRYGGDKFVIYLETENIEEVNIKMQKIKENVDKFNSGNKRYDLEYTYSAAVYDSKIYETASKLVDYLDKQVYLEKQSKK